MTDALKIGFLAIVQGITEFLPVSSSGHLVLAKTLVGLKTPEGPFLEVVLHAGTLVSICVYYRQRLMGLAQGLLQRQRQAWSFSLSVGLACLPAIAVYLLLGDTIETLFNRPQAAAGLLLATGVALLSLRWAPAPSKAASTGRWFAMGIAQAVAMMPGISRSGATITTGRWLGLDPEETAEMSFLMVLPLLAGAVLLEIPNLVSGEAQRGFATSSLILGFAIAAVSGYIALSALVKTLASRRFHWFGVYCLTMGVLALVAMAFT